MTKRTAPQNPEAEEAVIGAMLLSRDARATAADMLAPADFYTPLHAALFGVMLDLAAEGRPADRLVLIDRLTKLGITVDQQQILRLQSAAPVSANVTEYAAIVARLAAARRAILVLDEALGHAWNGDPNEALSVLERAHEQLNAPIEQVTPPTPASVLAAEDHDVDWIVRGLLARHETVLIVAEPGSGKSLWLNQFATLCASGLHPWTRLDIPAVRVLVFDFQDSRGARGRQVRELLTLAGRRYPARRGEPDTLFYELRSQGLDLTQRADQRWFEAKVAAARPDIVIAGPLYNMLKGAPGRSKQSEETAEMAARFLNELTVRRNCSLLIEAHAPHGEELRVRGSKYWEDWAGWGFGFRLAIEDGKRAYKVERFRGDREVGRQWPTKYVQGHADHWPWEPPPSAIPVDPSGGTEPMEIF
jgi:hypothetical protein